METEIELKFMIASEPALDHNAIKSALDALLKPYLVKKGHHSKKLSNTYFDTPEQQLRALDFGLRIRTFDGKSVQTMKTAGSVVGGLHKRPEYNLDIEQNTKPDLHAFDGQIWPAHVDVERLDRSLVPLFKTEFKRHTWLCQYESSQIEVVWDSGEISAVNGHSDIREIELELVEGDIRELFKLANHLLHQLPLRLSNDSKAARGYRLFQGEKLKNQSQIGVVELTETDTVEDAFIQAIHHGLSYWQFHEEAYLEQGKMQSLAEFVRGIWLVRHAFWLYQFAIPKSVCKEFWPRLKALIDQFDWLDEMLQYKQLVSKKGSFRKKIAGNESCFNFIDDKRKHLTEQHQIDKMFFSSEYSQLIIDLISWLSERGWRCHSDVVVKKLEKPVKKFASDLQQDGWLEVNKTMPPKQELSVSDYIDAERMLGRTLLTGVCVGALYGEADRQAFRDPWLDILQGVRDLKTFALLKTLIEAYQGKEAESLQCWSEKKATSLLSVMEQTRKSALKGAVYW